LTPQAGRLSFQVILTGIECRNCPNRWGFCDKKGKVPALPGQQIDCNRGRPLQKWEFYWVYVLIPQLRPTFQDPLAGDRHWKVARITIRSEPPCGKSRKSSSSARSGIGAESRGFRKGSWTVPDQAEPTPAMA
jgi:hypothetical protein